MINDATNVSDHFLPICKESLLTMRKFHKTTEVAGFLTVNAANCWLYSLKLPIGGLSALL